MTLTMNPALDIATATEIVAPTEKLRCGEPRYDPGGGVNVARAVRFVADTSELALAAADNDIFMLKTSLRELEELRSTGWRPPAW